jgi:membrane associated rhomboid family serine protease
MKRRHLSRRVTAVLARRLRNRWVTSILTALIMAMFARQVQLAMTCCNYTLTRIAFAPGDDVLLRCGAAYTGMPLQQEWWRLIASMFVHGGVIHLAANVLALLQLGYLLEGLFGSASVVLSFSIGGSLAGLLAVAFPGSAHGMIYVGASGAIFAIAGTLLVGLRRVQTTGRKSWPQRLSSRLVGCLAFNLVIGLAISAFAAWADLGFAIANTAHIAGLGAGILIGLVMPLKLRDNELTERMTRIA